MKILVGELDGRRSYITRQIYELMAGLVEDCEWRHVPTSRLWRAFGSLKDKIAYAAGELPEAVLFLEEYDFVMAHRKGMRELDCRKYFFADDLHANMPTKETVYASSEVVVSTAANVFAEMYPLLAGSVEVAWLPNSVTADFMLPFNENPENAIFLSGAINRHYLLRLRMRELYERRKWPIVYLPHPGYGCRFDHENDLNVGKGYARRINQYRTAFTDCLTFGYVVAKYFEIPATGALLLADGAVREPLRMLGFIEDEHYIAVSETNLEDRIAHVLDRRNHQKLDDVRRAGQKLVWENHKVSDRVRALHRICSGEVTSAAAHGDLAPRPAS